MYDLLEPSMDPGTGVSFASISVVATNRSGSARVPGDVVCFCLQNSTPISSDGVTISTNAYYLDARGGNNSATASRKIMAITLEDYAASSITATSIKGIYVLFDGINGFGGTAL